MQTNRITYLDSIRGLAALSVVFYHVIQAHWGWHLWAKISFFFINGSDAVSLFFVLSGLVLALQFKHLKIQKLTVAEFKGYAIKRILRIYPAYLLILLLNYSYHYRADLFGDLFLNIITNKHSLIQEAMLIREKYDYFTPGWTLGVEIALSLILPFLILLIYYDVKLFAVFVGIVIILNKSYFSIFTLHFSLGILIAYFFNSIETFNAKKYKTYKFRHLIYFLVLLLFGYRHFLEMINPGTWYDKIFKQILFLDVFHVTGLAAALIIIVVINNKRIQCILNHSILIFLGKISYSIYLVHWVIIDCLMDNWERLIKIFHTEQNMLLYYLLITTVLTLISATILYYTVEKPFIKFAKRIIN